MDGVLPVLITGRTTDSRRSYTFQTNSGGAVSEGWAREEVEATVAAYFGMLRAELSGTRYSKAEHRRRLLPLLQRRSEQSVEFKHANISAILIEPRTG